MRSALQERWNSTLAETHEVCPSMVEYTSFLLNRCEVGHDGKTAYERSEKKVATVLDLAFAEIVHFKKLNAPGKLSPKWESGIFLGVRATSGEVIVVDAEGVWETRTVHRRPLEERWDAKEARRLMQGIPRDTSREDGPYQDPASVVGEGDEEAEEFFGAWEHVEPAIASPRRRRSQADAPYNLRHEGGGEEKDEEEDSEGEEPAPYPFGDAPVSNRTRAGLRREAEAPQGEPAPPTWSQGRLRQGRQRQTRAKPESQRPTPLPRSSTA